MEGHPHLNTLFILFNSENQPFRKVHRMIDLFESIIKYHTAIIMSEYFRRNKISDNAKRLFVKSLERPSLGIWQNISRILKNELVAMNHDWIIQSFESAFVTLEGLLNQEVTNAITFRNKYAHGATPPDNECSEDIDKFLPLLNTLINFQWLANTEIRVDSFGKVWIKDVRTKEEGLCLFPILIYRYKEAFQSNFSFYNDTKNNSLNSLNYPYCYFSKYDSVEKAEFYQAIPLTTWKDNFSKNPFDQRIQELTHSFQGRLAELDELKKFVFNNEKGYVVVNGNPGIGKSTLLAKLSQNLKEEDKNNSIHLIMFFIKIDSEPFYFLEYLIFWTRKILGEKYVDVSPMVSDMFQLKENLINNLRQWTNFRNGKKLIFIIDGLDEGIENGLIDFLPFTETFEGVLFIYGSRKSGHPSLEKLFTNLPPEFHRYINLSGLTKKDIRALIYEVGNKYLIEKDSQWINSIETRSEGNPLYLKLLCNDLLNQLIEINADTLPGNIEDYFNRIINRFAYANDGDKLLLALYTFAAAKDYLSMSHIKFINDFKDDALVHRIKNMLLEILYENLNTKEVNDYQLFHESFRQFLIKENQTEVKLASDRIIEFCSNWKQYDGLWEQSYALNFYVDHLTENNSLNSQRLINLLRDDDYVNRQKEVFNNYEPTKKLYRKAVSFFNYDHNFEKIETICKLINLRNKEYQEAKVIYKFLSNDLDLLLLRLRILDGAGKQDKQNLFFMFMVCFIDLTITNRNSLNTDAKKIEQLLKLFDELIPNDHSIFDWKDFFSEKLMFLIADNLKNKNIDYTVLFKKTSSLDEDWLLTLETLTDSQTELLVSLSEKFPEIKENLSLGLVKNGKYDLAKEIALKCNYPSQPIGKIIHYLADKNPIQAKNFMDGLPGSFSVISSLKLLRYYDSKGESNSSINLLESIIQNLRAKPNAADYAFLSVYFQERGEMDQRDSYFENSVRLLKNEENDFFRSNLIEKVLESFIDLEKEDVLTELIDSIGIDFWKYIIYEKFINTLLRKNKYEVALHINENLNDEFHKIRFYAFIALSYFNSSRFDEGITILNRLEESDRQKNLLWIAKTMAENGLCEEAKELLSYKLTGKFEMDTWYKSLAIGYAKVNKKENSIECLKNIKENYIIQEAIKFMLNHIISENQSYDIKDYILDCFIQFDFDNQETKKDLVKKYKVPNIILESQPEENLIINEFTFDELIDEFNNSDIESKSEIWLKFLTIPISADELLILKDVLLIYLVSINERNPKNSYVIRKILPLFILNGHKEFAFYIIENYILENVERLHLYLDFSTDYIHNFKEISIEFLDKAISEIEIIGHEYSDYLKSKLYNQISLVCIKHKNFEAGVNYARLITLGETRNDCWNNMGIILINNDSFNQLFTVMGLIPEDEVIQFKKGIVGGLDVGKTSNEMINLLIPLILESTEMLDLLMFKYALNKKINSENNEISTLLNNSLNLEGFWNEDEPIIPRKIFGNYHTWRELVIGHQYAGIIEDFYQSVVNGTLSEASFNDLINSLNLNQ